MAEINKITNQPLPVGEQQVQKAAEAVEKLPAQIPNSGENSVGRGNAGQPLGLPPQTPLTQNDLMSDVVTGRDLSQLVAADKLRSNGGASATDVLLGLNHQPSILGGLLAPPGNLEALRHLTPSMRRNVLRTLLSKQRNQMRRLVAVARDEEQRHQRNEQNDDEEANATENLLPVSENHLGEIVFHNRRVYQDLAATTKMLDLLDELLNMQDYTLSQVGSFAQG
jgi:hypothetical protein